MNPHLAKILSGRFLLTICVGMCLVGMTATDDYVAITQAGAKLPFDPSAIMTIVGVVVTFYFAKPPDSLPPEAKP